MALFSDPALVLGDDGALVWPLAGFAAPRMALVASFFVGQSVRSGGATSVAMHGLPEKLFQKVTPHQPSVRWMPDRQVAGYRTAQRR